jgi:hypothetical protein
MRQPPAEAAGGEWRRARAGAHRGAGRQDADGDDEQSAAGGIEDCLQPRRIREQEPAELRRQTVDRVSKVKWDGAKLIITTTINFNGNPAETTQTWMLDGSGNLVVETSSNFTGTPTTTKSTYKRG